MNVLRFWKCILVRLDSKINTRLEGNLNDSKMKLDGKDAKGRSVGYIVQSQDACELWQSRLLFTILRVYLDTPESKTLGRDQSVHILTNLWPNWTFQF